MAGKNIAVPEIVEGQVVNEVAAPQAGKMEFRLINPTEDGFLRVIKWNKDELEEAVRQKISAYQNVVYTEDNMQQARADRAELNKLTKAIEDRRKMVKRIINEPYIVFEKELKDILVLIREPVDIIDKQVKAFEDQQKEEKKSKIREAYDEVIGDLADVFPFEKVFDSRYLNKTFKLVTAQADVRAKVEKVRTDLETIDGLESKYKLNAKDVYIKTLDLSKALAENRRLSELEEKLEAEKRRKAEEEAERKRLAEIRRKEAEEKARLEEERRKEQEAREKAEQESANKQPENVSEQPQNVIENQESGALPWESGVGSVPGMEGTAQNAAKDPAYATAVDPFVQQQATEQPEVKEKRYKTRFYAKGTRHQLGELIRFMNDNGIEYGRIKA